jgi:ureidoacrylate peracid hydrolase
VKYDSSSTGLVVIDPYNDFISEGGMVWERLKGVADEILKAISTSTA